MSSPCLWACFHPLSIFTGLYPLSGADEVSAKVVIEKSLSYTLLLMVPEQVWDCCSYCFCFFFLFFVSSSFVFCFVFPSLEFSVAGWRSVNLALPFLYHENGDFTILMRDIPSYDQYALSAYPHLPKVQELWWHWHGELTYIFMVMAESLSKSICHLK